MSEVWKLVIGVIVLVLAWPIGTFLAKLTKEELKAGRKLFKLIIVLSLIGGVINLILGDDVLLFTFLFIAVVTSRSLVESKRRKKKIG